MADSLVSQLKDLVGQIDKGSCSPPSPGCCPAPCGPSPPCCGGDSYITSCINKPYVQCTMLCPPPCVIPIEPNPVKPLMLPCPQCVNNEMSEERALKLRYANFYNNYNIDFHNTGEKDCGSDACCPPQKRRGTTVGGSDPCCEDYTKQREAKKKKCCLPGCPTGFKPCKMKLTPPPGCDPAGIWLAQVQPCPPKPRKKVSTFYKPGPCKRPGCKHWKPKEGPCLYDEPCKAHCYNHPQGIKPRKRH